MDENLDFQFPRASAYDEKIKKYRCEAELVIADTWKLPIKYESQLNDDDRHIVTVNGGIVWGNLRRIDKTLQQVKKIKQKETTPAGSN